MKNNKSIEVQCGIWHGYADYVEPESLNGNKEKPYWNVSVGDEDGNSFININMNSDNSSEVVYTVLDSITRSFRNGFNLGFRKGQISRSKEFLALLNDTYEKG